MSLVGYAVQFVNYLNRVLFKPKGEHFPWGAIFFPLNIYKKNLAKNTELSHFQLGTVQNDFHTIKM